MQNGTVEEVPSEYWLHYNATYHLPSYPLVEDQLAFMYNNKSPKSPKGAFEVVALDTRFNNANLGTAICRFRDGRIKFSGRA